VAMDGLSGPANLPASVPLLLDVRGQARWLTQAWKDAELLVRPLHPDRIVTLNG